MVKGNKKEVKYVVLRGIKMSDELFNAGKIRMEEIKNWYISERHPTTIQLLVCVNIKKWNIPEDNSIDTITLATSTKSIYLNTIMLHGMVLSQDVQLRRAQIECNEDAMMYLNADAQCTMTTMPPGPTNRVWCKALIKPTGSFYTKLDEDDGTVEAFRVKYKAHNLSFTTPMPDEADTRVPDLVFTTTEKEMNGYLSKFKPEDRNFVKGVLNKVEQELTVNTEDAEKYVMLVSKFQLYWNHMTALRLMM
eukprot:GHVR01119925.1.p1 GENE.GHVR01119925.1~~GHVR01119925.1.p1  ORF type:complete len:249 (+),score=30.92 GHVR01119925.1:3461-4207(+)